MDPVYWYLDEAGSTPSLEPFSPEENLHTLELARLKDMKIPKRREEWLHGRLTAKRLLTAPGLPLEDVPFPQIFITNQAEGAPEIAAPLTPGCLSISHREKLAVAAYTQIPDHTVGIDLEFIEPRAWSFIKDFFTTAEADYAHDLPEAEKNVWATLAWSAKEAVLKAWQKGLRLDTRRVEISPVPADQLASSPDTWQLLTWQAHLDGFPDCWLVWRRWGEYVLTLAGEKKKGDPHDEPPEIIQINR